MPNADGICTGCLFAVEISSGSHTAFNDACNILSRNMAKAGESIEWREILGPTAKKSATFACFVVLFLGVVAW